MRKFVFVILLFIGCNSICAQHWFGVALDADLAWQLDKINITTAKLGGGGSIGLVYQFQKNHFTIETGVSGSFSHNRVGVQDSLLSFPMIDTKGQAFIYNGYLKDRVDISNNLSLSVPLMIGMEHDYFYALVGAKLNLHLLSKTNQQALLSTTGDYDIYYDPLVNMPNHGFHDFAQEQTKGSMNYQMLDVRLAVEVGALLSPFKHSSKYRIGLFAEYGVLNSRSRTQNGTLLMPDLSEYMHISMDHIYSTPYQTSSPVNNITCGIRFTALFTVRARQSYVCRCVRDY